MKNRMKIYLMGKGVTKGARVRRRVIRSAMLQTIGCTICGRRLVDVVFTHDGHAVEISERCEQHLATNIDTGRPDGFVCSICVGRIQTVGEE